MRLNKLHHNNVLLRILSGFESITEQMGVAASHLSVLEQHIV
jgi:UTP:GlnB (protein PII) uridylyltransferase